MPSIRQTRTLVYAATPCARPSPRSRPLFPGLDAAVARAAEVVGEERDGVPRARLRRSVRERLEREAELRDVDFLHVEAAVRALEGGRSGTFHMKSGVALRIEDGAVRSINRE